MYSTTQPRRGVLDIDTRSSTAPRHVQYNALIALIGVHFEYNKYYYAYCTSAYLILQKGVKGIALLWILVVFLQSLSFSAAALFRVCITALRVYINDLAHVTRHVYPKLAEVEHKHFNENQSNYLHYRRIGNQSH